MNFFTCVAMTASRSFSLDGEGALSFIVQTSGGGKVSGLPSSFITCRLLMSPKHTGNCSILFFAKANTLSEVKFAIPSGTDLILFLLTSKISSDVISSI